MRCACKAGKREFVRWSEIVDDIRRTLPDMETIERLP
jgi:hypothetical protein